MENETSIRCIRTGLPLAKALGYQVCDTIVVASVLTYNGKTALRSMCRRLLAEYIGYDQSIDSSNMIDGLLKKANAFVDQSINSQVTKHGRVKPVDLTLLESITRKHEGSNSTVKSICTHYNRRTTQQAVSRSTIHVRLKRELGYRYRKLSIRNLKVKKVKYRREVQMFYARMRLASKANDVMLWLDECSFNDRNSQVKSWQRVDSDSIPQYDKGRVKSVSVMSVVTSKCLIQSHFNMKSNDSSIFVKIIKELISCVNMSSDTKDQYDAGRYHLVLDNAGIHRSEESMSYLKSTKLKVTFLPTYAPMLNNVELYWGKLKSHTRKYVCLTR